MAENKRPTRPVYNYDKDAGKTERGRPQRVSYDYAKDAGRLGQTGKKQRVQYRAAPTSPAPPTSIPAQDASPFYGSMPTEQQHKPPKKAQDDAYSEFMFPPRTVVTGTREIPAHSAQTARSTQRQAPVKMPQTHARGAAKSAAPGRAAAPTTARRRKPKQQAAKSKKNVVLLDARAQRRRRNIFAALGIALVIVAGIVLSFTVLFKIDTITVEGETTYTPDEVILAFGRKKGDNLLAFREQPVVEDMQKRLPYLEQIEIRRTLPGKVRLEVTQAVEAYSVSSVSGWVVLSDTLRVLRIDPQPPEGLPAIVGAEALQPVLGAAVELEDPAKLEALKAVQRELQLQALLPVTQIDVTDTLEINFVYAGRIRVILGTSNDLQNKIDWAKYLITPSGEDSLSETEQGVLDVSGRNEEGRIKGVWRAGAL